MKVLPVPGSLVTVASPSYMSAILRTVESPRPLPSTLTVCSFLMRMNSLKSLAASSGLSPMPVSATAIVDAVAAAPQPDVDAAAVAVVLDRVGDEVVEDDLDLAGVGAAASTSSGASSVTAMSRRAASTANSSIAAVGQLAQVDAAG